MFGVAFALLVLETLYEIPELGVHVYLLPTEDEKSEVAVELESSSSDKTTNSDKHKLISDDTKKSSYGTDE